MGDTRLSRIGRLIWFGSPDHGERVALAQAGWLIEPGDADAGFIADNGGDQVVVALADLRRSDDAGVRAMERLATDHPWIPWLGLVGRSVSADAFATGRILQMRIEFFTAPIDMALLLSALDRIVAEGAAPTVHPFAPRIVSARSAAMRATLEQLRKYAPVDLPVLITGETGTGKEVAACTVHELSARHARPFVAINCGALPANLIQSELFGYERGAFTGATARRIGHFEAANGGTVFLDEVGDLPLDAQTSLLRLLQEGTLARLGSSQLIKLDVRVLAATHVDLESAVSAGRFREDLYYRLNVLRVRMPALRERPEDIEPLVQHFLDAFRAQHSTRACALDHHARRALYRHAWPGNVRELLNRVQRAAVVAEHSLISVADLELQADAAISPTAPGLHGVRETTERETVLNCLTESRYNVSECARRLKVSRITVYRLCRKHGLTIERLRAHPLHHGGHSSHDGGRSGDGARRCRRKSGDDRQ